ncbi:MAG: dihydrolipoamide acetyltransferase family protein [Acidimicrobiia bacterium]|nr:MAG: dihydrolipoamide acetyltransferase family protein [Acidimicrobiia bacterium]
MVTEFYVPKMSDHMEEGTFVEWLVDEGDAVDKGQPILVIDTDKVVAEVEAPASGFLTGIRPGLVDGASISIGVTVAFIVDDLSEDVPALEELGAPPPEPESPPVAEATQSARVAEGATTSVRPDGGGPIRATPAARKAARELGVDLSSVSGTGPRGRVSESDVQRLAAQAAPAQPGLAGDGEEGWLELTQVQKVTARRMVESVTEVPQFSLTQRLDMFAVVAARDAVAADGRSKPSVTAFLVQAVASALSDHPRVNGFYRDGRIEINSGINIGVAFGTDAGLYVPVIHNADRLSVEEISEELAQLQALANGDGFSSSDLEGGTFTLSNLGMYGIDEFRAIVNPPQAAILATGRIWKDTSVASDGEISVRDLITATVTADHRSLDGVAVAEFLASISTCIGNVDSGIGGAG